MSNDEGRSAMKLQRVAVPDFDLEKTLDCGQVFHWERSGRGFAGAIGADYGVFFAGSSSSRNLRLVSKRSGDDGGRGLLSRPAHHSPTAVGMSGDFHLFVDETSGAHSPDFAGATETIW